MLGTAYKLKELEESLQVKMFSLELFLAKVECKQMLGIHSKVKDKGYSELDVVTECKNSTEDGHRCSDALCRQVESREHLTTSMARVSLQKSANEQAAKDYYKPRVTKPSRSVDAYDSYWESRKLPSKASLSLRKELLAMDVGDDLKDNIIGPSPSLLAMSSSPMVALMTFHLSLPSMALASYAPSAFPSKASAHDSLVHGAPMREKYVSQTLGLDRLPPVHSKSKPSTTATSHCGFCNRVGATNTCTQCSKVSCDACLGAYHYDPCCRKSKPHKFVANNQLNYKSTQFSHLVYR
ncbi:spermatogenesis-associated protein 2 [Sigmodon hispidus]